MMRIARMLVVPLILALPVSASSKPKTYRAGAFEIQQSITVPVTPEVAFDLFTGDVKGWWDHTASGKPDRLFIEATPGGGFMELFDKDGNGVRHATVTAADRGRLLRFEGALGLAGNALTMVHTVEFFGGEEGSEPSTVVTVTVRGYGQLEESWPTAVENVWHHFLVERFKRYVENGGEPLDG